MQFDKLFQLLARPDVKEIALQTDRPPCAQVGDQYVPVLGRNFVEDEVIAMLVEANGRTDVLGLMEGHRRWEFDHPTVGKIRVSAGYHGTLLQARFKLLAPASAAELALDPASFAMEPAAKPVKQTHGDDLDFGPAPPLRGKNVRHGGLDVGEPRARAARPTGAGALDFDVLPEPRAKPARPEPPAPPPAALDFGAPPAGESALEWDDLPPPNRPEPVVDELFEDARAVSQSEPANDYYEEAALPVPDEPEVDVSGAPAEVFESLLRLARTRGATDLHILADRAPTLRIAGELLPMGQVMSADLVERMLLTQVPKRVRNDLDQHGSCDFSLLHPTLGRFRTNVTRQRTGMKLTARPISDEVPTLASLGLPDSIAHATSHHQGLIVVTGPTGHGKTTTLAAIVDIINRQSTHHIITVEDPIEYVHPRKRSMISQREVGTHTRTFASALKGSLREDPDVIVVGELRDTDTVRMALSASETGHLVLSTMNTPSAAKAIDRIIDLFPPSDQPQVRMTLAGGLRLIISQRLVPSADRRSVCAAAEVLPGSPPLWALIRENKTFQIPSLQQRGKALGIVRLDDSLADLVRAGKTSMEIAREYSESPDQFEAVVSGRALRPADQTFTAQNLDPTKEAAAAAQKFGKDMFAKAGKLFGEKK